MSIDNNPRTHETSHEWWVTGPTGSVTGPHDTAALEGLARSGALAPGTPVCRTGQTSWQPLSAALDLPAEQWPAPTPPPQPAGGTPGSVLGQPLPTHPPLRPLDVTVAILLTVVTLGIWMLVWLHGTMHAYRRLSARTGTSLDALFWSFTGTLAVTALLSLFPPLLWAALVAGLVATVLGGVLLNEMLNDRDTAAAHAGIPGALHSRATLLGLFIGCNLLALTLIGLILAIPMSLAYLAMLFNDHNRLAGAIAGVT
jgi:hypothetical protein